MLSSVALHGNVIMLKNRTLLGSGTKCQYIDLEYRRGWEQKHKTNYNDIRNIFGIKYHNQ